MPTCDGRTITEASYSFIDNATGPEAHSFPELLVRRGIGERFELRLGVNYEAGGPGLASGTEVGAVVGRTCATATVGKVWLAFSD